MAQHTPGPWESVTNDRTNTILIRPVGGMELIVERPYAGDADSPVRARVEANAHLIAAAPDLLAALEEAAAAIECDCYIGSPGSLANWTCDVHRLINAAIAKARGEAVAP